MAVVENTDIGDLRTARWVFPLYLAVFSLFVIPIAAAGLLYFGPNSISPDRFVLALPMVTGADGLALFAFVGGFSAGTGMVIMATVALSTMVCNDLIMPGLMRVHGLGLAQRKDLSGLLLGIRRGGILALLLIAYGYYRLFGGYAMLSSIGLLSFAGCLQFLPAILGGLYIKRISRRAVTAGLITGFVVWGYTLVLPYMALAGMLPITLLQDGPLHIAWLNPHALFGFSMGDPITHGAFWSLTLNIVVTAVFSLLTSRTLIVRGQANAFVDIGNRLPVGYLPTLPGNVTISDLEVLVSRFLGVQTAQATLANYAQRHAMELRSSEPADVSLVSYCERLLAGVIGGASARLVLASALRRRELAIGDVVDLIEGTAAAVQFNRTLLQAAINNIDQGVSVIDQDLRLVAWNMRYQQLFEYPNKLLAVGCPVAELIRFNAERGVCGPGDVEMHIHKRLEYLREGRPHTFERIHSDGTVLEMRGNPMPDGGFVTTFNDITQHKHNVEALREINETLEQRVADRTTAVSRINAQLRRENSERSHAEATAGRARDEAERANRSKTRFLAAVSHDLVQPLHAARLFASTLADMDGDVAQTGSHIERSLQSAQVMINGLLDISRLDAQSWDVQISNFHVADLLRPLTTEFTALAAERGLALRVVPCSAVVCSDRNLLRRILQNFLTNALRYTSTGRILLGCRRTRHGIRVEVWDTGPGIPASEQERIFEEFHRVRVGGDSEPEGLGLGLAIAERMAHLLGHPLTMQSREGKGTVFSITVPRGQEKMARTQSVLSVAPIGGSLRGVSVLCVDDDPLALAGLVSILQGWSCDVAGARGRADLRDAVAPDILVADYRLDGEADGLHLIAELRARWQADLPALLVTGDRTNDLHAAVRSVDVGLLHKPIKPAALRATLTQLLRQATEDTR